MAADWEAKAGTIDVKTPKYTWTQTIDEVHVLINIPPGTRAKDILLDVNEKKLHVSIKSTKEVILQGSLYATVKTKDLIWTLEDNKIDLILVKAIQHQSWSSVIEGEHELDPLTKEEMDKKMMLEKFQSEHPGFDFSGAQFTGQVPKDPANFMKFN